MAQDLTGQLFGRLLVLSKAESIKRENGGTRSRWLCECQCSDEMLVIVETDKLKSGNTKSCGCYRRENTRKLGEQTKPSTYDLCGEYGIGYTSKGEEFYFDLEDYDKIKSQGWSINSDGYLKCAITENNKQVFYKMHRLVLELTHEDLVEVDHINKNKRDNRKSNLRLCTHEENMKNIKLSIVNKTGVTGVSWYKNTNKWNVRVRIDKREICIGYFENFQDAVKARLSAEKKYYGEFAPQRHLFEKYNIN